MTSMALAALFWVAIHLLVAGPLRPAISGRTGENGFRGLFSLLSALGLVWLIVAYRAAPAVPVWDPPPGLRWVTLALMFLAFPLLVFGAAGDNPTSPAGDRLWGVEIPARGITRITRHPMLWAFAFWALGHLLTRGDLATVLLCGAILVTALNGMASIDRKRGRALGPAWTSFEARTSRVPFAAIVAGRNELVLSELSPARVAIGIALFLAALFVHRWLGVPPLPG